MPDDRGDCFGERPPPAASDLRAAGVPLSDAALGRQFDMSERWGRDRVAEVQRHDTPNDRCRPAGRDAEPATRDEPTHTPPGPVLAPAGDAVPVAAIVVEDGTGDRDAVADGGSCR